MRLGNGRGRRCTAGSSLSWHHMTVAPVHPATVRAAGDGTDGDHDGITSVYGPVDAIPSAARHPRANGAPADMKAALLAYNHSAIYARLVLSWAARHAAGGTLICAHDTGCHCQDDGATE